MKHSHPYCAYLTEYLGTVLPPYYIGSSTVQKVLGGYHGSVRSKKWRSIYETELKNNPHLFKTTILISTLTRSMSTSAELYLQKKYNVVKSTLFFNESIATKNGCFGRDSSGSNNGMWGKTSDDFPEGTYSKTDEHKQKISKSGIKTRSTEEWKQTIGKFAYDKGYKTRELNGTSQRGSGNGNAKLILIYDSVGVVRYSAKGNFRKLCEMHNLPFHNLSKSYKNGLPLLWNNNSNISTKWISKFNGWFSISVKSLNFHLYK